MRYLLDTNIVSDLIRHPQGTVVQKISSIGDTEICTSIIVASELRFGVTRRGSEKLAAQVQAVISTLKVISFEAPADKFYGDIRTALERDGQPIGNNDLFIAAHAMALGCCLVTDNEREFGRVAGLTYENWLR